MTASPRFGGDAEAPFSRLSAAEAAFVRDWNRTAVEYPRDATIQALFEEETRRSPDSVALVPYGEGQELTYGEVNRRANRLARHLARVGVREETRVAVHLERSCDAIIAMLGVLKAGGACVPLDPALPLARASFLLEDCEPGVVISRERLADGLPSTWARLLCVDTDAEAIGRESDENPPACGSPSGLAAILYTSGSTGQPKGVAVVHRGVIRLVRGPSYARFGPDEVFLQAAPLSFDASTFEIWGALANGGRLVVLGHAVPSLEMLGDAIRRHGVTTLWLTAGLFHLMVDERLEDLKPLRRLIAGGDVLSPARVRRALAALPGCELVNGYGPTESTTFAACHAIRDLPPDVETVPIGRPIANTRIYVLDGQMRWVPPGEPGEIYIGGDGLARGYWRRPALDAERFVASPFGLEGAGRLYKSGDLARLRFDGELEFLGRVDRQIKVHGFRVEPAEIEARLERHPGVARAVVEPRETGRGGRQLVAYLVPRSDRAPSDAELRLFLQDQLPDYMLPAAFETLYSLPLTPSGKVDRRALPEPVRDQPTNFHPPASEMETRIAAVWSSVLRLDAVDRDSNFFDLGGNSLLLIEAHARLERRLELPLPITAIFEHPTVRSLARSLAQPPEDALREWRERLRRARRDFEFDSPSRPA
jgi:amino acid adenylation domain-containing protein